MTFGHTITLWCSRLYQLWNNFHNVLILCQTRDSDIHLYDHIIDILSSCHNDLSTSPWNYLNLSIIQTRDSSSKYTQHLLKSSVKNITISTIRLSTHWTAHIKMCYFQQVAILFHLTENEAFQSSCPCGMICISQVIQNQVSPNGPFAWSSSCIYTNRHGSHVSNFSKTSESKDPSTWSFFMRFIPIWLTWQCHK